MSVSVEVYDATDELVRSDSSTSPVRIIPMGDDLTVYDETLGVTANTITDVISYTVPALKQVYIKHILASGTNVSVFTLEVNGSVVAKQRTYYTHFNTEFTFSPDPNAGLIYHEGDVIKVRAEHYNVAMAGDFNATVLMRIEGD